MKDSRAVLYLRQSKDRDGTGFAVDRQREACLARVRERGWQLVGEYEDNDTSASGPKPREHYERMLADAEAGLFGVIVVWEIDRLTRKLTDLEHLITMCERTGVRIVAVSGDLDLSTDAGRLVGRILASVARGEVERKSSRQVAAAKQRADKGEPAPAKRAFGYMADGKRLNPREAPALGLLYGRAVEQINTEGTVNVSELAAWLNALRLRDGRPVKQGGRRVKPPRGDVWQRTGVRAVLLNPRNAGLRAYSPKVQGRRRTSIVGDAAWKPAVERDVWDLVTAALRSPERRKQRNAAPKWLLTDLGACGRCDDGTRVLTTYREDGRRVYRCKRTPHLSRTAEPIDALVRDVIVARLSRPDAVDLLTRQDESGDAAELEQLRKRLSADLARRRDLGRAFAEGAIGYDALTAGTKVLDRRIEEAQARLAIGSRPDVLAEMVGTEDVGATFDAMPLGARRTVIRALFDVVLLPNGPGRRVFDPSTVRFDWRHG